MLGHTATLSMTSTVKINGTLTLHDGNIDNHGQTLSATGLSWDGGNLNGGTPASKGTFNLALAGAGSISLTAGQTVTCGDDFNLSGNNTLTFTGGSSTSAVQFTTGANLNVDGPITELDTNNGKFTVDGSEKASLTTGGRWVEQRGTDGSPYTFTSSLALTITAGLLSVKDNSTLNFDTSSIRIIDRTDHISILNNANGALEGIIVNDRGTLGFMDVLYNTGDIQSNTSTGIAIPGATFHGLTGAASFKMEGGGLRVDGDNFNVVGTMNFSNCALQIYSGDIYIKVYEGSGSPARGTCDLLNVTSGSCFINNSNTTGDPNDAVLSLSTAALPSGTEVPSGQSAPCIQVGGSGNTVTGDFSTLNGLSVVIDDDSGHSWTIGRNGTNTQYLVRTTF